MTLSVSSSGTSSNQLSVLREISNLQSDINATQNRISSGTRFSSPVDNASTYVIARNMERQVADLSIVGTNLSLMKSTVEVAIFGAEAVADLLMEMKRVALTAADPLLDASGRRTLNEEFITLRSQIVAITATASFNGTNLLNAPAEVALINTGSNSNQMGLGDNNGQGNGRDKARGNGNGVSKGNGGGNRNAVGRGNGRNSDGGPSTETNSETTRNSEVSASVNTLSAWASADGKHRISISYEDLSLGGDIIALTRDTTIDDAKTAAAAVGIIDQSIKNVIRSASKLATGLQSLEHHQLFTEKLKSSLRSEIGNIIDTNLTRNSAHLQALLIREQLAMQALAIANHESTHILTLFDSINSKIS